VIRGGNPDDLAHGPHVPQRRREAPHSSGRPRSGFHTGEWSRLPEQVTKRRLVVLPSDMFGELLNQAELRLEVLREPHAIEPGLDLPLGTR
jgi:hypothetical protein